MQYCPQCGQKVNEGVAFCPNCGASLKPEESAKAQQPVKTTPTPAPKPRSSWEEREEQRRARREERHRRRTELRERREEEKHEEKEVEKSEKQEKGEKGEKREERGPTVAGLLAGGFIIFLLGLVFYLEVTGVLPSAETWPIWWSGVFFVVIVLAVYGARTARRRYPKTK
jgi:cation transport ATPase